VVPKLSVTTSSVIVLIVICIRGPPDPRYYFLPASFSRPASIYCKVLGGKILESLRRLQHSFTRALRRGKHTGQHMSTGQNFSFSDTGPQVFRG